MIGYIGEKARQRKRKKIFFFIIIIIILIVYLLPDFNDKKIIIPSNNLIPTQKEIISTDLDTSVEDLKLKIFDKDQKIFFRNAKIEKLQDKIKDLKIENKKIVLRYDESSKILEDLNLEINNKNKNNKLNLQIQKLKKDNNFLNKKITKTDKEFFNLKENFQIILDKNLSLNDLKEELKIRIFQLENKIINNKIIIEEQNLLIQELKKTPHG